MCLTRFSRFAFVALAVALLAGSALEAQDDGARPQGGRQRGFGGPGGGPGFGGFGGFGGGRGPGGGRIDKATLLGSEQIQKELKIGEDQAFFVKELVDSQREKSRELFSSLGNIREMSEEDRRKAFEEMGAKREKLAAEAEKEIEAFLSEDQRARLDQIALQLQGIRALTDEKVAGKLSITDAQKEQLQAVFDGQGEAMRKVFEEARGAGGGQNNNGGGRGGFNFEGMREKMDELNKQTEGKALAVLNQQQQDQFAAMKGKPFEVDRRALFGGGRGPGGPGGQRGPGGQGGGRPQRPAAE